MPFPCGQLPSSAPARLGGALTTEQRWCLGQRERGDPPPSGIVPRFPHPTRSSPARPTRRYAALVAEKSVPSARKPKEFGDQDLSGAVFRETDLSRARMTGVLLIGADIDGAIDGLVVNGVEVAPLISDELDRLHPERVKLRPTDAAGCREAWQVVESMWAPTMARAQALPDADQHRSVDGEYSFAQTLRHLVFATDAWFGRALLGREHAFHPLGLPASFITDGAAFGIDEAAEPTYAEVVAVRNDRLAGVRDYLATVTDDELTRTRRADSDVGWPPPEQRTALACLMVILDEEWAHHQFAVRDLDRLAAPAT